MTLACSCGICRRSSVLLRPISQLMPASPCARLRQRPPCVGQLLKRRCASVVESANVVACPMPLPLTQTPVPSSSALSPAQRRGPSGESGGATARKSPLISVVPHVSIMSSAVQHSTASMISRSRTSSVKGNHPSLFSSSMVTRRTPTAAGFPLEHHRPRERDRGGMAVDSLNSLPGILPVLVTNPSRLLQQIPA